VKPLSPGKADRRDLVNNPPGGHMNFGNLLHWALIFLIVAIIAGVLGFGGVAGTAMEGARLLFWVAIILLILSLVFGVLRRG
jgi:uncharacterized membrane protein YtjA (UPF0391 family)